MANTNTIMKLVKELPDDLKLYIMRYINPLSLVFLNKFFYTKYHQAYMYSQFHLFFEKETSTQTTLMSHTLPIFEPKSISNYLHINYNFNYSKWLIQHICYSIKHNYAFTLLSIFNDGTPILYKINHYLKNKREYCKWMNLRIYTLSSETQRYDDIFNYFYDIIRNAEYQNKPKHSKLISNIITFFYNNVLIYDEYTIIDEYHKLPNGATHYAPKQRDKKGKDKRKTIKTKVKGWGNC